MAIEWSRDLETGYENVDTQHKKLFALVNDLLDACAHGRDTETLQGTLDFLVQYTLQHFRDEEALQLIYRYPEYDRHKREHEDFKKTVGVLVQRFQESGSSSELSHDVSKFVGAWFLRHIQVKDKQMALHVRSEMPR